MKLTTKIVILWGLYLIALNWSLLLPHRSFDTLGLLNLSFQFLVFLVCLFLTLNEPVHTKPIFLNFSLFFFFSVFIYFGFFVGFIVWTTQVYAPILYYQYVNIVGYDFVLTIAIVYFLLHMILPKLSTLKKYLITCSLVLIFFGKIFHPIVMDPFFLYKAEAYSTFLRAEKMRADLQPTFQREPTLQEVAKSLIAQEQVKTIANEEPAIAEKINKLQELELYRAGDNHALLFWSPLFEKKLLIHGFIVFLLVLFYTFKFFLDPPASVYLEKIGLSIFMYSVFEFLHYWSYMKSPEIGIYLEILSLGQYVTILIFLIMIVLFSLRLKFVRSVVGKYYEQQIQLEPESVTRWRDEIDSMFIAHFFKPMKLLGRLAVFRKK